MDCTLQFGHNDKRQMQNTLRRTAATTSVRYFVGALYNRGQMVNREARQTAGLLQGVRLPLG